MEKEWQRGGQSGTGSVSCFWGVARKGVSQSLSETMETKGSDEQGNCLMASKAVASPGQGGRPRPAPILPGCTNSHPGPRVVTPGSR